MLVPKIKEDGMRLAVDAFVGEEDGIAVIVFGPKAKYLLCGVHVEEYVVVHRNVLVCPDCVIRIGDIVVIEIIIKMQELQHVMLIHLHEHVIYLQNQLIL